MKISPVVIPTLNRYEHLKKCIDSLRNNSLAKDTELYISVDYPPSEKYRIGYDAVLQYLSNPIEGFRKVNVFIQEENLGASENGHFLYAKAFEDYDSLIFTEDDNIFSSNFLEYMNKTMEKYENDKSVYAVTGYRWPFNLEKRAESFKCSFISAWGCGLWKDRVDEFERFRREELLHFLKNVSNRRQFSRWNYHVYKQSVYVACEKHHMQIYRHNKGENVYRDADFIVVMYMYIKGMKVIVPYVSKVRNLGHDGSGENCDDHNASLYVEQEIDMRDTFDENAEAIDLNMEENAALSCFHESNDHTGLKERIKLFLMLKFMMK